MTDKDRNEFIKFMEDYKVKLSKSKKLSREFLVRVGIITPKGNRTKMYKHFHIPSR